MRLVTPIQRHDKHWAKRDDLYEFAGCFGGKVRACQAILKDWMDTHGTAPVGLITGTGRASAQLQLVARVAERLGIQARCHCPEGQPSPEMLDAQAHGADLVQHKAGYSSVIKLRAEADAKERPKWCPIPYGMAHPAAVQATRRQVYGLPPGARRLVIPLGGGVNAAGVLWGLRDLATQPGPGFQVIGIQVGGNPRPNLERLAPAFWHQQITIVKSRHNYTDAVAGMIGDVTLDPYYEAKCLEHLQPEDLLWIVGKRVAA